MPPSLAYLVGGASMKTDSHALDLATAPHAKGSQERRSRGNPASRGEGIRRWHDLLKAMDCEDAYVRSHTTVCKEVKSLETRIPIQLTRFKIPGADNTLSLSAYGSV